MNCEKCGKPIGADDIVYSEVYIDGKVEDYECLCSSCDEKKVVKSITISLEKVLSLNQPLYCYQGIVF